MRLIDNVPEGSIYYWCYIQGLKHIDLRDVEHAVHQASKIMRDKDVANYWAGYYNSDLYKDGESSRSILKFCQVDRSTNTFYEMKYSEYPENPFVGKPEPPNRWVPCSDAGRPLIKWGNGCLLKSEAMALSPNRKLAENLKGCQHIAIDIDGDHDDELDYQTIIFGHHLSKRTYSMLKPVTVEDVLLKTNKDVTNFRGNVLDMTTSMHILFTTDKVIPTMHFANAHIDIIGNEKNSIRYLKNKVPNDLEMIPMTDDIWESLVDYIREREHK